MKQPFVCISCGYEAHHKSSMWNHFYRKKKPCPKLNTDIILTDNIKEYILHNRVYKPASTRSKEPKQEKPCHKDEVQLGYIYLIREREFFNNNVPVYKVGMTIQKTASCALERLKDYKKGSELCTVMPVSPTHCLEIETRIKRAFRETFQKHNDGHEYFEGEPWKMIQIMFGIIDQWTPMKTNISIS